LGKHLREKEQTLADVGDRLSLGLAAKQVKKSREYLLIKGISRVARKKKRVVSATTDSADDATNLAEPSAID
jgi:hypothetical protein